MRKRTPPINRFWPKVDRRGPDDCWPWTAGFSSEGYGQFWDGERQNYAHRFAYELLIGPVPKSLELDHLCRVRHCVNPAHLEPVTRRENLIRGETIIARNATKTHCKRGHPLNEANTYWCRGIRQCRTCRTYHDRRRRARTR